MRLVPPLEEPPVRRLEDPDLLLEPLDEPLRLLLLLLARLGDELPRLEADELPRLEAEERLRAELLEPEGLRRLCWEP